ncbi:MAG: transglycosylase SLT domain-containing protein [Gammaproteobacteria bacterium]|nr:transglycosylase SLT domain-containing protein [Gammaproteobacteria bacterium]MBT3722125.1 transglycosylase SLT domain-containing protein [Gammaproteobacteria bacterium]MBT4076337.1 transglycosylase SLT domain-containing protein [Gammaproteobacteria bacterium]MBT4194624.1 transglycosylase SLT domain-containing protein [Gammaproteobacteria bacterium]MBT4448898.1 transglycosylase SLT domain-containing protein [Gammaproteobacteria bacterium]
MIISLLVFMAINNGHARAIESDKWHDKFDRHFKKYSKRYFGPHFEWRWFKSQGIAESNLNENASSPVGAKGIMQIMPATFEEIKEQNPTYIGLNVPRWNIAAGIFYDRQLYRKWRKPLPSDERLFLAFSSYNAGYGRVLKAVKRTRKDNYTWIEVKKHLPAETRGYVSRIATLMDTTNRHRKTNLRRFSDLFN